MVGIVTADVTGDATVALAALTAVLAIAAAVGAWLTYQALKSARTDSVEATKSRIDQRAPHVVFIAEAPANSTRFWRSDGEIVELEAGDAITNDQQEIGLMGWFRMVNQGSSTAIVGIPPKTLVLPGDGLPVGLEHPLLKQPRPETSSTRALEPGGRLFLLMQAPRTFGEWKQIAEMDRPPHLWITVTAEDTFSEGIEDATELQFYGVPIMRNNQGAWVGGPSQPTTLRVAKTVRNYPNLQGVRTK